MRRFLRLVVFSAFNLLFPVMLQASNEEVSCMRMVEDNNFSRDMFYIDQLIDISDFFILDGPSNAFSAVNRGLDTQIKHWEDMLSRYPYSDEQRKRFTDLQGRYQENFELRTKYEAALARIDELEKQQAAQKQSQSTNPRKTGSE